MKTLLLLAAIILHSVIASAQRYEWLTYSSSPGFTGEYRTPVATDVSGNVYAMTIMGSSGITIQDSTFASLNGNPSYLVMKLNPTGDLIWGKVISTNGGSATGGDRIVIDTDGSVYVSVINYGQTVIDDTTYTINSSNTQLIKFNSAGHFVRAIGYFGTSASPRTAILRNDIYVASTVNGFGSVQKLDTMFNVIWTVSETNGIAVFDGSGGGGGVTDIYVQDNGELIVSVVEGGINAIGNLPFGDGIIPFGAGGQNDVAIVKMDTSGHVLWSKVINHWEFPHAVALDHQGNAYFSMVNVNNYELHFAADTINSARSTILKWDAAGNEVWARGLYNVVGGTGVRIMQLEVNDQEDLLVSGYSNCMSFNNDTTVNESSANLRCFLLKCNSAGTFQWYKSEDNNQDFTGSRGDGIAIRNGNEYVFGGTSGFTTNDFAFGCFSYSQVTSLNTFITVVSEEPENGSANFTVTNTGSAYSFTNLASGATSWHWDFDDGDTSNVQNPVHTFTGSGSYSVVLTVTTGSCVSMDSTQITIVGIDGINNDPDFSIYPNPSTGIFNFKSTGKNISSLSVYDLSGRLLQQIEIKNKPEVQIDLSGYDNSVFILKAENENTTRFFKLLKQ